MNGMRNKKEEIGYMTKIGMAIKSAGRKLVDFQEEAWYRNAKKHSVGDVIIW